MLTPKWGTSAKAVIAMALHAILLSVGSVAAQDPDTLATPPDSLQQAADSVAAADTLPPPTFPRFPDPAGGELGLASRWDMPDLLSTGALTLGKYLEFTPFLDPIRGGFLEGPGLAVFAGRGPASLRVNADGYEIVPILGGALDLRTEPLAQLQEMSLIAEPGGYRIYTHSYRNPRTEPYSRIEAGTGDNRANLLRGFLSSTLGRSLVGFGYDRIDTTGEGALGDSERAVVWMTLARRLLWGVWGQLEYRNSITDRATFPSPQRRDWVLRLRRPFENGWHTDLIAGSARLKIEPVETEAEVLERSVRQVGLRVAKAADRWRTYLAVRYWDGENMPPVEAEGSFEVEAGRASLYTSGRYAYWEDFHSASLLASFRYRLPLGLRALAEAEEGDRGIFGRLPRRRLGFTRWTVGAEAQLWTWKVGARTGRWRSDPSPGVGAPIDSIVALPGGTVSVGETWAGGRLLSLFGGTLEGIGRYTWRAEGDFLYWPQDGWRLDGIYRLLALSEQLEVKLSGMIGRRGPMWVQDLSVGGEGILLSGEMDWWRVEAVVRVKDLYIFYNFEYYNSPTLLGDVPGLTLPPTRYHFGVKWEFWN